MARRSSFSPDINGMTSPPPFYFTNNLKNNLNTPQQQPMFKILAYNPTKHSSSSFSPMRFLGRIKAKFAKALGFVSLSSRKISSSSSPPSSVSSYAPVPVSACNCSGLERSRSYAELFDMHRAQAIEDCIQFLNSSSDLSSFQRSKSVSSFCY